MNDIEKAFRQEHLKELQKYSLGELIEAIDSIQGVSRRDISSKEVYTLPNRFCPKNIKCYEQGSAIIFRLRGISKEDRRTIITEVNIMEDD